MGGQEGGFGYYRFQLGGVSLHFTWKGILDKLLTVKLQPSKFMENILICSSESKLIEFFVVCLSFVVLSLAAHKTTIDVNLCLRN